MNLKGRSFLTLKDFTAEEINYFLDLAAELKDKKKKGILVRHFTSEKIKDYNRITIGTPEQMQALTAAIKEILEESL